MKSPKYQKRFYRSWVCPEKLYRSQVAVLESDLLILSDKEFKKEFLERRIKFYRDKIQDYINYKDRRFLTSLKPIAVELTAHKIIKEMARQSKKANVGPMAAVAGAIAQFLGRDLIRLGCRNVIIENGGDVFLKVTKPVKVGLFAGRRNLFNNIALSIDPKHTPMGICASSGRIGHSLSFGNVNCAVILSKNAILADSAATAVANMVNYKKDIAKAVNFARALKEVKGVIIILGKNLASWGQVNFSK